MRRTQISVCILVIAVTGVVDTVAAANNTTSKPPSGGGGGGLDIGEEFKNALSSVLMDLVKGLAETLNAVLLRIFVSYPDVTKSWVRETHQDVFIVSLVLASAAAVWIGVMHMTGRTDGIRSLISLLFAIAFGAVAPDLLYYPVEISRLTTKALAPADSNIIELSRFSFEVLLILALDVFLLLGTVMIFVARDFYLMLGVALAPLIALMAATPVLRRFADALTSVWVAFLLIGPLNVVVLDLSLALMGNSMDDTTHYLWGLGGIALLFGLPLILLGAGTLVFAPMTRIATQATGKVKGGVDRSVNRLRNNQANEDYERGQDRNRDRRNRFRNRGDD